mmetsp:Transcript_91/g.299  ORF Transcript_91/g.299 Transcript_91/m.299 type:complete len:538 (-) Transcript_91:749-2362(-)
MDADLTILRHEVEHLVRVGLVDVHHVDEGVAELGVVEAADGAADPLVDLQDFLELSDSVVLPEGVDRGAGSGHDGCPRRVGLGQESEQALSPVQGLLGGGRGQPVRQHARRRFVERVYLMGFELPRVDGDLLRELIEVRLLVVLPRHELALALLGDFQERVAGHVPDPRVQFVHELEELVHDGPEELPVRSEEPRVLADHVHDVRRDDGLVVFPTLVLTQVQEVLDDDDQEPLLLLLGHGTGDGADGPAQRVQAVRRPRRPVHLGRELVQHDRVRVVVVQVRQEDQGLPHGLVLGDDLRVPLGLAHNVPVLVLDHQNLLGLGHLANHHRPDPVQERLGSVRLALPRRRHTTAATKGQRGALPRAELGRRRVQFARKIPPVVEADFKNLVVLQLRNADQVEQPMVQGTLVLRGLQKGQVGLEKVRQEEGKELDELFIRVGVVIECSNGRRVRLDDLRDLVEELDVHLDKHGVVLLVLEGGDLREALNGRVPEHRNRKELFHEEQDQRRLEDVAKRNPGQEALEGDEGAIQERRALAAL